MEIFLQLQVFSGNTKAHAAGMTAAKEGVRQVSGGEKGREHKGAEHLFKCSKQRSSLQLKRSDDRWTDRNKHMASGKERRRERKETEREREK